MPVVILPPLGLDTWTAVYYSLRIRGLSWFGDGPRGFYSFEHLEGRVYKMCGAIMRKMKDDEDFGA